jgi:hypothetical protein
VNFVDEFVLSLLTSKSFEHPLYDAAAVGVGSKMGDIAQYRVVDELDILQGYPLDCLLHNVVAVLIPNGIEDSRFELLDQDRLLIVEDMFEGLHHVSDIQLDLQRAALPSVPRGSHTSGLRAP